MWTSVAGATRAWLVPRAAIAIVNEAQPLEREHVVHLRDVLRLARDQMRQSTGGDALCVRAQLGDHALEDRVDQPDVPPEKADLQIVDGVRADNLRRPANLNARQTRRAREE